MFFCPQGRDMEENLLPHCEELDYNYIFKLSIAPQLAHEGMGTAGID